MPKTIRSWQNTINNLYQDTHSEESVKNLLLQCHINLSNAYIHYNNNKMEAVHYNDYKTPEGFFVELAKCLSNILILSEKHQIDIEHVLSIVHEYDSKDKE